MSNICRFTVPASRDIESIIDFIADSSNFSAAERFLNKINEKSRTLANSPNIGRKRDQLVPSLRSFSVDDYVVFYRLIEGAITLLTSSVLWWQILP